MSQNSENSDEESPRRSRKKFKPSVCKNKNHITEETLNLDVTRGNGKGGGSDPADSKTFRRQVRNQYRDVLEDLHVNAKEYVDHGNFNITEKLLQVDKLYNSVTQTREAAMDSSTIAHIAMLGKQKAQALKTDMFTFHSTDFAQRLSVFVGSKRGEGIPSTKWKTLGQRVSKYFRSAPSYTCMLGTFERSAYVGKEKVVKQRNKVDKDEFLNNKTQVKEMDRVETTNEETTAKMTEFVHSQLKKYYRNYNEEPIDYFEFICDPNSFGKTVENIFYLSFLVREGMAKVFLDDDKLPVIEPCERQVDKDGNPVMGNTRLFSQVAVGLTYPQWREIIDVYKIEHATIQRPKEMRGAKEKGSTRGDEPSTSRA